MIGWLLLAMVVIPAVELFLLLQLGAWMGPWQTFALVVVTGTVGAWLAKREGLGVLTSLRDELAQGLPPGSRLAEGALVLVGGILLITPGVLTDLTGFLFIAPPTRRAPAVAGIANPFAGRYEEDLDADKRRQAMWRIDEIVHDEAFYIPFWNAPYLRVVYWDYIRFPKTWLPPRTEQTIDYLVTWFDPSRKAALEQAMKDNKPLPSEGSLDKDYYGLRAKTAAR